MTGAAGISDVVAAAILGLVEGITEFIPVSSTGHLILAGELLSRTAETWKTFEVVIQLGAILAVVWMYRTLFLEVARGMGRTPASRKFILNLLAGFLPAAVVGLAARDFIKAHLFQGNTVAWGLILGALGILVVERFAPAPRIESAETLPLKIAFGVGLAQVLALYPGVSRSGATIMGAYALGCSRRAAAEFSFFLAVPVMFAASALDLYKSRDLLTLSDLPAFTVGMVVSFVSALLVLKAFIRFVSSSSFRPFAWYRLALGALILFLSSRGA
ncbi:MAG: undecaprenyl-diphosphatase [Gemmatimonadetes bacterium]|nr:undecaprenyl-diphosphatase [Gemmatimonadota bacterium]